MRFESNQTIGVELEMYVSKNVQVANKPASPVTGKKLSRKQRKRRNGIRIPKHPERTPTKPFRYVQYVGVKGMEKRLKEKCVDLFDVVPDCSLGRIGAEVKFKSGIPLKKVNKYIDAMHNIARDTKIEPYFGIDKKSNYIPPHLRSNKLFKTTAINNTTGLHIHFGLPSDYKVLDIFRLLQYMDKHHDEVCRLAWRKSNHWACRPKEHTLKYLKKTLGDSSERHLHMFSTKNDAVNLSNVDNRYFTIEFRYATAALMTDKDAFYRYLEFLKDAWDKCFTGESTMRLGRYYLKEENDEMEISKGIFFKKYLKTYALNHKRP